MPSEVHVAPLPQPARFVRAGCAENGELLSVVIDPETAAANSERLAGAVLDCYVNPEDLTRMASESGRRASEVLALVMPTKAALQSGDFGEMLVWLMASDGPERVQLPLKRWRLRATQDDTVRGIDLIGYVQAAQAPSAADILILCETKTRAKRRNPRVVRTAYDSVRRDCLTRLASQLVFQQARLRDQGNAAAARALARFSPAFPKYRVRVVAAVVHEERIWSDDFLDYLPRQHDIEGEMHVVVVRVQGLLEWIARVRDAACEWADR